MKNMNDYKMRPTMLTPMDKETLIVLRQFHFASLLVCLTLMAIVYFNQDNTPVLIGVLISGLAVTWTIVYVNYKYGVKR